MRNRHVLAIDLVRFGCALLVVAHHYAAMLPLAGLALPTAAADYTWFGWIGVELFFVVSGYVIAMSATAGSAGQFLQRRALRLVPAAWIAATLTTLVALTAAVAPPAELFARWAASMSFSPLAGQVDPAYWTLGVECAFYLLVTAGLTTRAGARMVVPIGLTLALASLTFWLVRGGWHAPASSSRLIDLSLLPHGAFFAIGIALSGIAERGWSPVRAAMLVTGLTAGICEIAAQSRFFIDGLGLHAGPAAPLAVFVVGVAIIAGAGRLQRPLERFGASFRFAGMMTYPLYLIHQRAGAILIAALCGLGVAGGVAMLATAACALLVASAIARWAEPALRRWLAARLAAFSPSRGLARDTRRNASLPAG